MKTKTLVIGAIAATTLLIGGWAVAQSVGHGRFMHGQGLEGMGPGMKHGMDPGAMQGMKYGTGPGGMHGGLGRAFADSVRTDALKAELGITPAQEQAWGKYAKAVHETVAAMKTTRDSIDPSALSKMSPSDRFEFASKMRERGQKQFGSVEAAAEELLAALDATQKAKATDILPGLAFGPDLTRGAIAGDQQQKC